VNPTAAQYALIGATTAGALSGPSLALLNSVVGAQETAGVDTIAELEALAAIVGRVVTTAAGGTPTPLLSVADFEAIGITGTTAALIDGVRTRIAQTADDGTGVDTVGELQALVSALSGALARLSAYAGSGSAPPVQDYADAGVAGVTDLNVAAMNSALAVLSSAATDTTAEVQAAVDAYRVILAEANGAVADATPGSAPTASHYAQVGATVVETLAGSALSLMNSAVGDLETTAVDTVAKLNGLADIAGRVLLTAAGGTPTPLLSVADLTALSVTGATADGIVAIRRAIANTDDSGSGIDTIAKLKALVTAGEDAAAAARARLQSYAGSGTAPTVDDYENAGVTGATSGNVSAMNSALAGLPTTSRDTVPEVQAMVTAYALILGEANGSDPDATPTANPTTATYAAIGATTAASLLGPGVGLLNDVLGGLDAPAVDTVTEIDALAGIVARLLQVARGLSPTPALTTTDFSLLGVTGVFDGNLSTVLAAVAGTADDGSGIDTVAKLQTLVTATGAVGVTLSGPATASIDGSVTLTATIVDARGRPTVLLAPAQFRLTSTAAGATFVPGSPLTLPVGTATTTVVYQSSTSGAQTVEMTWLEPGTDTRALNRTSGTLSLTIVRKQQAINFGSIPTQGLGEQTIPLSAVASSTLAVSYVTRTPAVCTVSLGVIRLVAAGTCTIRASQAGDATWQAAADVDRSFAVTLPTIQWERSDTTLLATGGVSQLNVSVTPSTTGWTAVSSAAWLTTTSTGVGSGTVTMRADAYTGTVARTATLTVGGTTHRVTQLPDIQLWMRVAEVAGELVTLQWTYQGPPTAGFVVEGDVVPGGRLAVLPMGDVNMLTVRVGAGRYFARVRLAEDPTGRQPSNEVSVLVGQPDLPSVPTRPLVLVDGTTVTLNWTNTFEGGEPTGVDLLVDGMAPIPLGRVSAASFVNAPVGPHTVRLRAWAASGASAASEAVTLTVPGTCTAPAPPTWFSIGREGRRLTARWEPGDTGAAATEYWITAEGLGVYPTGGARLASGEVPPGTYRIWVQAVNRCGASGLSAIRTVTVP
jgi:hypothetical protein